MARLPNPGSDDGVWGEILNDFLSQSHAADGSLKSSAVQASGAATDSAVVHITGSENIAGTKTFQASPVVPAPTLGSHAATKLYVDSAVSSGTSDATTTSKGVVQLAGDLTGTAAAPAIATGAVTSAKIATGTIVDSNISSGAAIAKSKLASLNIVDADVSAISESKITNLASDLASKAPASRTITAGSGLSGGGDLTADRSLSVNFGTGAGTVAQGNDSRITGAVQVSVATTKGDVLAASAASTIVRQGVGSDGQVLTADSTQTTGLKWTTPVALDSTATHIQLPGTQAAGSTGKAADAGHVHPVTHWIPSDNGLLTAATAPELATSASGVLTAGTVYLVKIPIRSGLTASTIWYRVSNAGSGASSGSFVGIYNSSGTLLSSCSDIGSNLTATGVYSTALTSAQALTAGTFIWVAFLENLATTQAQLNSFASASSTLINLGLTRSTFRAATLTTTGQTSLPASFTPATTITNSSSAGIPLWFGIS